MKKQEEESGWHYTAARMYVFVHNNMQAGKNLVMAPQCTESQFTYIHIVRFSILPLKGIFKILAFFSRKQHKFRRKEICLLVAKKAAELFY